MTEFSKGIIESIKHELNASIIKKNASKQAQDVFL